MSHKDAAIHYFVYHVSAGTKLEDESYSGMAMGPPTLLGRLQLFGPNYQATKHWAWEAKPGEIFVVGRVMLICCGKKPPKLKYCVNVEETVHRYEIKEANPSRIGKRWRPNTHVTKEKSIKHHTSNSLGGKDSSRHRKTKRKGRS